MLSQSSSAAGIPALADQQAVGATRPDAPIGSADSSTGTTLTSKRPRSFVSLSVFALIGIIAFVGHRSSWSLAGLGSMLGDGATAQPDWCNEHNLPEADCIECRPDLLPKGKDYGWCKVHGVSQCVLEHPDLAQLAHASSVDDNDRAQVMRALAVMPRAENNSRCKLYKQRLQFASLEAAEKAGIDIAVASRQAIIESITAPAEIIYDQTRAAHLSSRVSGAVWRVQRRIGESVNKGDILALIDSVQVGEAKADYLKAVTQTQLTSATLERLKPLVQEGGIAGRQFREAEAALKQAQIQLLSSQQALLNLGFPLDTAKLAKLDSDELAVQLRTLGLPREVLEMPGDISLTSNLVPLRAPLSGLIVSSHAVAGESVQAGETIFEVADTSHMWLMLNVRQEDAEFISEGQTVMFRATAGSLKESDVRGQITWISTAADERSRTIQVRAEVDNRGRKLRAHTFGLGRIVMREEPRAIVIPSDAVHNDGCCSVVFVRDKNYLRKDHPKFFHIRQVRLGVKEDAGTEIIAGLLPGEVVASKGSVVLEAQLLKNKLGEGCGCAK